MKILVFGSEGYIGSNIYNYLSNQINIQLFKGESRCDNYKEVNKEITTVKPDRIICCIGRASGKNIYSTSYIENKLDINLNDNLFSQLVLVKCCNEHNIHLTHIGDGCIFNESLDKIFEEEDEPNLKCSSHAIVKSYTEKIIKLFAHNFLHVRIRYPISGDFHPKCLLTKLASYEKVINKDTSISIFKDILPILLNLIKEKKMGTYNLVNPESINLINTKLLFKQKIDSLLTISEYSIEEHNKEIGERSHVQLTTSKIQDLYYINNSKLSLNNIIDDMLSICKPITKCLCCLSDNKILLDLGYQPLANNFHVKNELSEIYPLKLMYCPNCFHSQLSHAVNPEILFKNYKYVSGTSQTGLDFFKENAQFIHNYKNLKNGNILDIACNDGSQLDFFKELNWNTYGVDPATNLCPIAEAKCHTIICDFWNDTAATKLPIMDVITAQNVFAHTEYIDAFLQSCKIVMNKETSLFIQTSQRDMIMNGEFDTTYHEHISFYNTKSMKTLVERNGLELNRVLEHNIHGRSYIFEIKLKLDEKINNVNEHLEIEKSLGLYNSITYDKFNLNAIRCVNNLKTEINNYRKDYKCIGFGAAAKGQTLICYGNIDLDYIIDENPLKTGLFSPKLDIPIVNIEHFIGDKHEKFLIVILAWNFAKEIKEKINSVKGNKKIVIIEKYFPEIIISYF
jgi:dTDP-4-dehydrorhamnose reductase/2-polyprenyl-3-methyl-5-hydroxy-6-metoxy-1,4-benzoquinol methylase